MREGAVVVTLTAFTIGYMIRMDTRMVAQRLTRVQIKRRRLPTIHARMRSATGIVFVDKSMVISMPLWTESAMLAVLM